MSAWSDRLRHAGDAEELQGAFERVLALLKSIYKSYYDYHSKATAVASLHPERITTERTAYMRKLCAILGLGEVPPCACSTSVCVCLFVHFSVCLCLLSNSPRLVRTDSDFPPAT